MVYYTFGEPLLVPYLDEVLLHGKQLGLVQVLMTNGYYFSYERATEMKKKGLTSVCVSIDSQDQTRHDQNRGLEGAFHHAVSAIGNAKAVGLPVGIGCTVTDKNQTELDQIEQLGRKLSVNYISFLRERRCGILERENDSDYRRFAMDYFLHPQDHCSLMFHDITLNPALLEAYHNGIISAENHVKYSTMNCCHCAYTLSIAPNGSVSRCNLASRKIGNIHQETLTDILSKETIGFANNACYPQFSETRDGIPCTTIT